MECAWPGLTFVNDENCLYKFLSSDVDECAIGTHNCSIDGPV